MTKEYANKIKNIGKENLEILTDFVDPTDMHALVKHFDLICAYADGKGIQYKCVDENEMTWWVDDDDPYFEEGEEYRIKPERWRAEEDGIYYYITTKYGKPAVMETNDTYCDVDNDRYASLNYFKTMEQGRCVAKTIESTFVEFHKNKKD